MSASTLYESPRVLAAAVFAAASVVALILTLGPLIASIGSIALFTIILLNVYLRAGLVALISAFCLFPYWWGATVLGYLPLVALLAVSLLPGLIARRLRSGQKLSLSATDVFVTSFVALVAALALTGASMYGHSFVALGQWVPAYLVGRMIVREVGSDFLLRVVAIIFTGLSILAIIEFATQWNPFYATVPDSAQYAKIGAAQERGGVVRTEWAFGHSIALGNSLALSLPFVLAARLPRIFTVLGASTVLLATTLTFSRSAMISAAIAVVLAIWVGRNNLSTRARIYLVAACIAASLIAIPILTSVFEASSAETSRSAGHRVRLAGMLGDLNFVGTANGYTESAGVFSWNGVISIDNSFIRLAVNFGALGAALVLLSIIPPIYRCLIRSASVADMSVASVVPALFTVALITQFGILFWLLLGLSAALNESENPGRGNPRKITTTRMERYSHA